MTPPDPHRRPAPVRLETNEFAFTDRRARHYTIGAQRPQPAQPELSHRRVDASHQRTTKLTVMRTGLTEGSGARPPVRHQVAAGAEDDRERVCVVIPAYNEAGRIGGVLDTLAQVDALDEIIIVDDGSLDGTSDAVRAHPIMSQSRTRLLRHEPNRGKGATMLAGAESTTCPIVVFFDADLINLKPRHVEDLIRPISVQGKSMALGVFRGGNWATTLAQVLAPNISGQRAIRRDVFLNVPRLTESGYGVELAITNYVFAEGLPYGHVILKDVSHPMKETKLGIWRGTAARIRMYWQMSPQAMLQTARRLRLKR